MLLLTMTLLLINHTLPNINFGQDKSGTDWMIINDGVMGGLSKGKLEFMENSLLFSGTVSLANNGGFSSLKSRFQSFDLSNYSKVKIRLRSNGIRVAFTMETDQRWYYPYFKKDMLTQSTDWEEITLDLNKFEQYRVGRKTGKNPDQADLANIIRLGLITNEKKEGPFEVEIDYIKFE